MSGHRFIRCCVFLIGVAAYAQLPFGFGIKGGLGLTDAYATVGSAFTQSAAKDPIVGAFAELRLPFGLGAEADALYRPVSLEANPGTTSFLPPNGRYTTWEFPILAKYRLPVWHIKPIVEVGPSFRSHSSGALALTSSGLTVGGGVEFKVPVVRLSSDLRYTRWTQSDFTDVLPNANQVELLFGISF